MTESAGRIGFFVSRLLPIAAAGIVFAGCSTTNLEDVAPVASMQSPQTLPETVAVPPANASEPATDQVAVLPPEPPADPVAPPQPAAPAVRDAINTGSFPNLNLAPGTAAPQFTPAERSSKLAQLGAKRSAAQAAPGANAAAEADKVKRLRKLAQTHATDTLKKIEAE